VGPIPELEASLHTFAEFLLKRQLVRPNAAPFIVRWVRQFLACPPSPTSLADRVRTFCEDLERAGWQEWQIHQADQALRLYFVNFLARTHWEDTPRNNVVGADGRTDPVAALHSLRIRIRTRHYSYRTESSYVDWVRRFLNYLTQHDEPQPRVSA